MARLTDLNDDVVHEILLHVPAHLLQPCLCALALTCRFFAYEATRRIYDHITIGKDGGGSGRVQLLKRSLCQPLDPKRSERLGSHVRTFDLLVADVDEGLLHDIDDLLSLFCNLQRLRVAGAARRMLNWSPSFLERNPLRQLRHAISTVRDLRWSSAAVVKLVSLGSIESVCLTDVTYDFKGIAFPPLGVKPHKTAPLQVLDLGHETDIPYRALYGILTASGGARKLKTWLPGPCEAGKRRYRHDPRNQSYYLLSPARILQSLRPALATLQHLNLVGAGRSWNHDGSLFDLSAFEGLRVLKVAATLYFATWDNRGPIHHLLPRSLEELAVFFFQPWVIFPVHEPTNDVWLIQLARSKCCGVLARLQRVSVEGHLSNDNGRREHVQLEFEAAEIEFNLEHTRTHERLFRSNQYGPESHRFDHLFR